MTVNPSGWRPATPANEPGEAQTVTGNRALMLEEPLLFEIGSIEQTGVDRRAGKVAAHRAAGPLRARSRAPLHAPVAAELRNRPRAFSARIVHDEA
jgi:glycine dehydrogenase subunit 2